MERLMTEVFVRGIGAVSAAGWGVSHLREALDAARPLPLQELERRGWQKQLRARRVPPPPARPAFLGHARLRRTSPISHYAVAAALEALGEDAAKIAAGSARTGIVMCVMSGCVNYSRRFYDETLRDPATASPLLFPETVFNAPGSHLAALLGTMALNYTLVGDPGTFLQGLAVAAEWLTHGELDGCLVVGAEELDWLTADAYRLFSQDIILSEGAGAVYLRLQPAGESAVKLGEITDSHLFHGRIPQIRATVRMRSQLAGGGAGDLLCDSRTGVPSLDRGEMKAWNSWPGTRVSPKIVFGEGLMAAAAWQTVAAVDAIQQGRCSQALVSVVGCNQQVIGARFSA
jgi:3-oxoacyl-(acyl-carrier-protein) synthase